MPRFNIKQLLIIIAVVSCWLSTRLVDYDTGIEFRQLMLLLGLAASGLTAFCSRGRRQVFWLGFFAVAAVFAYNWMVIPTLNWIPQFSQRSFLDNGDSAADITVPRFLVAQFGSAPSEYSFLQLADETIRILFVVIVSSVAGLIGVYIYNQTQKRADN